MTLDYFIAEFNVLFVLAALAVLVASCLYIGSWLFTLLVSVWRACTWCVRYAAARTARRNRERVVHVPPAKTPDATQTAHTAIFRGGGGSTGPPCVFRDACVTVDKTTGK